jgi:hypothetical protein
MLRRAVAVVVLPAALSLGACGASEPPRASAPRLPAGVVDARADVLYAARIEPRGALTRLRALRSHDGRTLRARTIPGRWVIPAVAGDEFAGALSGDGSTLALAGPSGEGTSAFALVGTRFAGPPQTVTLHGRFDFDALSPDGGVMYVIQHRGRGVYWVRAYDVAAHRLRPGAIVEKGETDPDMTGRPVARALAPGGSPVYTLYRGGDHGAFVHALSTDAGIAICVDLPGAGAWRLEWAGTRLYAVDATRRVAIT